MAKPLPSPSPERVPVLSFVGAGEDLLFWEKVDLKFQRTRDQPIGSPHWDPIKYPNHKLVYKTPLDAAGQWHKFFYAADREDQEAYNFEFTGDQLSRSFLVLREKYYARTEAQSLVAVPLIENEFTRPVVGTADERFADFVYAEDTLSRTDTELDSLYILVRQIYLPERLVTYQWDDVLQRVIKVTKQVVAAQTEEGSGDYGIQVEIQPNNIFNDFKITSEVVWLPGDLDADGNPNYPIQIDSVAGDAKYEFPLLLKSIEVYGAWAYAASEAPPSYNEDFFFEIDIVEPSPGPYDATVLRFVTDDPDAVRALYPTDRITARAETFGMIRWWAAASDDGNSTYALARQHNAPATVHDEIELPALVNYVQGGSRPDAICAPGSESLPATPGYSDYIASTTTIAGVDTRRSRLGLWEVQVTRINAGGSTVYASDTSTSRIMRAGTGTGDLNGIIPPAGVAVYLFTSPSSADENSATRIVIAGGSFTFSVWSANPFTWTTPDSWISSAVAAVQPGSPIEALDFTFTYLANGTGAARTGTIVFVNSTTGETKTFTVTQPG